MIPFENRKVIALDIGGVCVSLNFAGCFRAFGVVPGTPLPSEFANACGKLETGDITEDAWIRIFSSVTGNRRSPAELIDIWNSMIGPDLPGMADAVRTLSGRGYRFVYFSNTSQLHLDEVARKNSFGHLVTGGIYSFSEHCAKPDPAIYRAFERDYGKPFAYFDDRAENIEGGRSAGWNSILFESPAQFLRTLS